MGVQPGLGRVALWPSVGKPMVSALGGVKKPAPPSAPDKQSLPYVPGSWKPKPFAGPLP
jgi:hypothetical protein